MRTLILLMKKQSQPLDFGHAILHWEMPEYAHHEKSKTWFFIAGIVVLAIIIYALITAEYTMAIVFALLAGVYYILHNETPRNVTVSITTLGIIVDKDFFQFSDIQNFWIVYQPPKVGALYLRPVKRTASDIRIELMEQNPMVLRNLLKTQIKELQGEGENLVDKMTRLLRL